MKNEFKLNKSSPTPQSSNSSFFCGEEGVSKCNDKLLKYFHPENSSLIERFRHIYKIFNLTDDKIARKVGIDRTTMNRYRRGVFIPVTQMKILIAKAISELANYPIDSANIWGEDLIYSKWKEEVKNEGY